MSATANTTPGEGISVRVESGGAELLEPLAAGWRALCDEARDEIFYRPEWTQAYLAAFTPQAKLTVLTAWAKPTPEPQPQTKERLRGILPLVRERALLGGLPAVRLALPANVHCFRLGMALCPGEEGDRVLRALWQAVKMLPGWNVLDVSHVLEGSGLDRLAALARDERFPVARKRTTQTLYLPIAAASATAPVSAKSPASANSNDQPPWMAETRPKFRSHLRRARRQLEEQGALELKHFSAADPAALQRFYDLEASGWKGAEGTAIQCDPRTRRLYDAVAEAAARQGYLSLDFLELGGKPLAGHFGFNFRGRYFLAKAGYDESYRRFGPGQLLVNEILNQTLERGLDEFDFVGPATWDESRWASARRTSYRIFIFRKNWYGALLYALRISARDFARRLLGRQEDENAPIELKSKPQGADAEKASDKESEAGKESVAGKEKPAVPEKTRSKEKDRSKEKARSAEKTSSQEKPSGQATPGRKSPGADS